MKKTIPDREIIRKMLKKILCYLKSYIKYFNFSLKKNDLLYDLHGTLHQIVDNREQKD